MKWFECICDLGDGSSTTRRFHTKESACNWAEDQDDFEEWDCYPYGPLEEINTDNKYFWTDYGN